MLFDKALVIKKPDDLIIHFIAEILGQPESIFVKLKEDDAGEVVEMQVYPPEGGQSAAEQLTFYVNLETDAVRLVKGGTFLNSIPLTEEDSEMVQKTITMALEAPVFDGSQCVTVKELTL